MTESKKIYITIPRMSCKRLSTIAAAIQKAKEGCDIIIHDIGSGQDISITSRKEHKDR